MSKESETVAAAKKEFVAHGVPITSKRVNLFSILLTSKKALSAYELADLYHEVFSAPIPAITVYRVLEFLQANDLAHKLDTANKFVACSQFDCKHTHPASQCLICDRCLKVKELGMSGAKFEELKQTIEEAGFHLDTQQLEMNCICIDCHSGMTN